MSTVLANTKELLGIPSDVTDFDNQLVIHINSVFTTLHDLGVIGDEDTPYIITATTGSLTDFLPDDDGIHNTVQMYIYTKVRIVFDPPSSAAVLAALEKTISEYEWRLTDYTSQNS